MFFPFQVSVDEKPKKLHFITKPTITAIISERKACKNLAMCLKTHDLCFMDVHFQAIPMNTLLVIRERQLNT